MQLPAQAIDAILVTGASGSGKTTTLLTRVRDVLASGTAPEDILVVCASEAHAAEVARELPCVQVLSPQALSCSVLAALRECPAEGAPFASVERQVSAPRVFKPHEERILLEDLRACGLPRKQLQSIFSYLRACTAALADDGDWIQMKEERLVLDALEAACAFTGGMLAEQVPNAAVKAFLADPAAASKRVAISHVFVDDYGLLSRATQVLVNLIASSCITVTGEHGFCAEAEDRFPHPAGLEEFPSLHEHTEYVQLPDSGEVRALLKTEQIRTQNVQEELSGIVSLVKERLAGGVRPSDIAVVGQNGPWRSHMKRALTDAGIAVTGARQGLRMGDFTDEAGMVEVLSDALAGLERNPRDGVCVRTLLAYGDYLAGSVEVAKLRRDNPGRTLADLYGEDCETIRSAIARARRATAERTGEAGSRQAHARGPFDAALSTDGAAEAVPEDGVFLGAAEDLVLRHFDTVIFGGYLAGWIPGQAYFDALGDRRARLLDEARLDLDLAYRAARHQFIHSSFEYCPLELAERLGLRFDGIKLVRGRRICRTIPASEILGN